MYKPYSKTLDNITYIVCILLLIAGCIIAVLEKYHNLEYTDFHTMCTLNYLTGYYCPGCGGTRAVYYFLSGHIMKSIYYNAIVAYTIIPGIWFLISQTIYRIRVGLKGSITYSNKTKIINHIFKPASVQIWYIYAGISILLLQCAAKNILHFSTGFIL